MFKPRASSNYSFAKNKNFFLFNFVLQYHEKNRMNLKYSVLLLETVRYKLNLYQPSWKRRILPIIPESRRETVFESSCFFSVFHRDFYPLRKHAYISVNFRAAAGQRKLSSDGERNTANTFDTVPLHGPEKRICNPPRISTVLLFFAYNTIAFVWLKLYFRDFQRWNQIWRSNGIGRKTKFISYTTKF